MGEQANAGSEERAPRFTDRGERFTRRGFLKSAGMAGLAVGTGTLLAGCQFNYGPDHGQTPGQSSTSGQNATSSPGDSGQGSSGSSGGMS